VAVQSINTDIRAVGAVLKAREQEELVERLEGIEEALEQRKGEHRYGA
jgi:type II secretory pathway pseudopilin PulG